AQGEGENAPTTDKAVNSVSTPGRYAVFASHSIFNPGESSKGVGLFTGDGNIGRDGVTKFTNDEEGNLKTENAPLPPFNATAVIASSCEINGAVPAFTSQMATGTTLVYNSGGDDGLVGTRTVEYEAYEAAKVLVN